MAKNPQNNMFSDLNKHMHAEMYAAYLYFSMATYLKDRHLNGLAQWMYVQAKEEQEHAMKFYNYLMDRGFKPVLGELSAPKNTWKTITEVFKDADNHERMVTGLIYKLYEKAMGLKDYATTNFLEWFIKEQVEEESNSSENLAMAEIINENTNGLFAWDHRMGKREED